MVAWYHKGEKSQKQFETSWQQDAYPVNQTVSKQCTPACNSQIHHLTHPQKNSRQTSLHYFYQSDRIR